MARVTDALGRSIPTWETTNFHASFKACHKVTHSGQDVRTVSIVVTVTVGVLHTCLTDLAVKCFATGSV
jgi:hypothetical protein